LGRPENPGAGLIWRAVDDEGEVIDMIVEKRRGTGAAVRIVKTSRRERNAMAIDERKDLRRGFHRPNPRFVAQVSSIFSKRPPPQRNHY
jgi:transposase-like protein